MNLMLQRSLLYIQKKANPKNNLYALSFLVSFIFPVTDTTAQSKYEFRGVWVATLTNIDWPSDKYLSTDSQKTEFTRLLDMHQRNGINAVIVQVRPATDAIYPSQYEPWSEWLTGIQGKPPVPYYDPLEFMISECHKRGMEFHAWMNPYRAELNIDKSSISQTHITKLHPDWFLTYGSLKLFDPGNKEVQQYVTNIVSDVVSRYDIDAIHFDDYFYPYPLAGKQFPDEATFAKYGNGLSRADWRRSNVDSIILMLSKAIKQENKYCKFGISPFGVWRSNDRDTEGSNTRGSLTNYDDLYADILLWLKNKWIDYVAPQLYWEFSQRTAPFGTLADWWAKHSYERHLYIGHGIYRALQGYAAWKNPAELPNQIKRIRQYPQIHGSAYYSSKIFNRNPNGWNDSLQNNYYKYPAIVPPMPWIDSTKPLKPILLFDSTLGIEFTDSITLFLRSTNKSFTGKFVLYTFPDSSKIDLTNPQNIKAIVPVTKNFYNFLFQSIPMDMLKIKIGITAVSKTNMESNISRYIILERKPGGWRIASDPGNH